MTEFTKVQSAKETKDDSSDVVNTIASDNITTTSHSVNPNNFFGSNLTKAISTEPCTLSGGSKSTCYRITVSGVPGDNHPMGPWCPRTIKDKSDAGGIWLEGGQVYNVNGPFVSNLATFYKDNKWKLYNDDGTIRVTDSKESCEAAAKPDVDPAYQNYCVECQVSYLDTATTKTFILPVAPIMTAPQQIGRDGVGVALNGVSYDPPAPTDAILGAYTLAPFDDCGGHVNPTAGYHYHASTGCAHSVQQTQGHSALAGYALDGIGMYEMLNEDGSEPTDLDECRGHTTAELGYHYHLASAGENMFIGCFKAEVGCSFFGDASGQTCDGSQQQGAGGSPSEGGPSDGTTPPAGNPSLQMCSEAITTRCCGDNICDGPETSDNCSADCSN